MMDEKNIKPFQRVMSAILCMAMILSMLILPAYAAKSVYVEEPLATIFAASDFQLQDSAGTDDLEGAANQMRAIISTIKDEYTSMDGAFFLGDYSVKYEEATTKQGLAKVQSVINTAWGLGNDKVIYVQGNHDPFVDGMDATGGQEFEHYNVFVMNNKDFPWQQGKSGSSATNKATVEATAKKLEAFLKARVDNNDNRPVFVTSHVPLHYTKRSNSGWKYDNTYAKYIFDVLNEYGEKLNIIFIFGHNHSSDHDDYLGGAAIYLPVGEEIFIPVAEQNTYTTKKLNFTYMNGGYVGFYGGKCETQLSSTVIEIYDNRVEVARYDKDGEANLKDMGDASNGSVSQANTTVYTNDSEQASIARKNVDVHLDYGALSDGQMYKGGQAVLTIRGEHNTEYSVEWKSSASAIAGVEPASDGMSAVISGNTAGKAKITATVTELGNTRAAGKVTTLECNVEVLNSVSTEKEVLISKGKHTYYKRVSSITKDKEYAFVDMEDEGYKIGRQMALQYNGKADAKENDEVNNGTNEYPDNEFNACPVDVFELPINGVSETLTNVDSSCSWTASNASAGYWDFYLKYNNDENQKRYIFLSENENMDYDPDLDRLRAKHSKPSGFFWLYDSNDGLRTSLVGSQFKYVLFYDQAKMDFSAYRTDNRNTAQRVNETVNSRVYAFEKVAFTIDKDITAYLSDTVGYVNKDVGYDDADGKRLGGAQTGDKIIINDGTGEIEVNLTIDMLSGSFDVTKPGVYSGLSINYAGKTIAEGAYTLVVNDSATIIKNDAAREYMDNLYVLTDTMVPGKQYLITDTDEAGIGHAMGISRSSVFAYNVLAQQLPVNGEEKVFIDSSRYSWKGSSSTSADITASNLVGRGITDQGNINEFMRDTYAERVNYQYAIRLVWSPTQLMYVSNTEKYTSNDAEYSFLESNMQAAGYADKRWLSIKKDAVDNQLILLEAPKTGTHDSISITNSWWYHWKYDNGIQLNASQRINCSYLFYNFQNMIKTSSVPHDEAGNKIRHDDPANKNFQTVNNTPIPKRKNHEIRRTWVYERVTDIDTISARISDKSATVTQRVEGVNTATNSTTFTGDYILVDTTHADGTVTTDQVPVTISMLTGSFDLTKPGTYPKLTVTYQGVEVCSDYTLTINKFVADDYPEFPNEGAVRISKYLDTTYYNYLDTGVAAIDLSVSGIPAQTGIDLVIMLDTSSSMENCVHAVAQGTYCEKCGVTISEGTTRLAVLEDKLEDMLTALKEPVNGYVPDIDVAIADFNGYTPINTDYCVQSPNFNIEVNQQVTEDKHDGANVLVPFTDIENLDPKYLNANDDKVDIQNNPGTNYDRAMELTYDLLYDKQVKNAVNGVTRKPIVVFMSDGVPYQYNYFCGAANQPNWNMYLAGTLTANDTAVTSQGDAVVNAFKDYYNGGNGNKHWLAEAIKANPNTMNKIIDPDAMTRNHINYIHGLGATMYTIGFGLAPDTRIELATLESVLKGIATDEDHYISVDNNEKLAEAFEDIAKMIRESSAKDAVFKDQMGSEFDLVTSNEISAKRTDNSINLVDLGTPSITIKQYDLYKRGDIGTVVDGVTVTELMVGERKNKAPTEIETVTFSDDGKQVFSDKKEGNILNGKVIEAKTFFYNTDTKEAHNIVVNGNTIPLELEPETFYWLVGDIPENELVMTYFVYLTGSMEGTRPAGIYDTNTYAKLNYVNYLGNDCEQEVPTPKLPWNKAMVSYAFYLVDRNGNPIINQKTGAVGSFERSVEITQPIIYSEFYMNAVEQTITAQEVAEISLPEGYTLYDKDAVYNVSVASNGGGTCVVGKGVDRATTYIQGVRSEDINPVEPVEDIENYATANTTVWFAVYAQPQSKPDSVVIDYGIPVDIHVMANDLHMYTDQAELVGIGAKTDETFTANLVDGFGVEYKKGKFGTAKIVNSGVNNTSKATIRYTLNTNKGMQMNDVEKFSYAVKYYGPHGEEGYYYSTVTIIPAANMYYEDNFLTFSDSTKATDTNGKWQYDVTLSCYNIENWSEVYAYCKDDSGPAGTWPGVKMEDRDGDKIYTAIVSFDQIGKSVIFNNGDKNYQTGNLTTYGNNAVYKSDGSWSIYGSDTSKVNRVYFNNTNNWANVNAYMWNASGEDKIWPGTKALKDAEKDLYYIDVPAGMTNIIFNNSYEGIDNNAKIQTSNLAVENNIVYQPNGTYTYLGKDEPETNLVYFDSPGIQWNEVYAHWWNADGGTSWPGNKMGYDSDKSLYFIEVPSNMTNIIFSNNRPDPGYNLGQITVTDRNKVYRENRWEYGSDTIEVIFDNTSSAWDSVNAYYWNYGDTGMSSWPGVKMTEGDNNLWYLDVPINAEYIVFNSGSSMMQTNDITIQKSPGTIYFPDGSVKVNSTANKTYYYKGNKWETVYAYAWDENKNACVEWPGQQMTYDKETGLYSVTVPYNMHNILFHNYKGEQTPDLLLPMSGSIYYGDIWSDYDGDLYIQDEDRPGMVEDALSNIDADNVYGYDSAYGEFKKHSLGSAPKVVVDAATGAKNEAPNVSFTFTGIGFDVVSLTDNRSGAVMVEVYPVNDDGTLGNRVRSTIVSNYYGYTLKDGEWKVDTEASNCLYQVPVVKMSGLEYGKYKVVITAAYLKNLDAQKTGSYTIWIDAIRTYVPAKNSTIANSAYEADLEANASFAKVRDILVNQDSFNSTSDVTGAVFIDGFVEGADEKPSITQYSNEGPNNEAYLTNGQAVAFELITKSTLKPTSIQLGAKLAKGDRVVLKQNNKAIKTIETATNMFYKLDVNWTDNGDGTWSSGTIILSCEAAEGSVLSLTDLKVTSKNSVSFETSANANVDDLLSVYSEPIVFAVARKDIAAVAADMLTQEDIIYGDVNGDGEVSIIDATMIQMHLAMIQMLDEEQQKAADVNNDSSLSISDATFIQRYVAELIPSLPIE